MDISIQIFCSILSELGLANTAVCLLKNDPKTFSLLDSAVQILPSSVRLDGHCNVGGQPSSGLFRSQDSGSTRIHSHFILSMRLRSLSCRKMNHSVGLQHSGKRVFLQKINALGCICLQPVVLPCT